MFFIIVYVLHLLALAESANGTAFYGVDLKSIGPLKHQHFQGHQIGWSGLSKDGVTRVYVAPNSDSAELWIAKMKKRHYKSTFVEIESAADRTLWDNNNVMISQFGLLLVLIQGQNITERQARLKELFVTSEPSPPFAPLIILQDNNYQLQLEPIWQYTFVGGTPIYSSDSVQFKHLPDTLTLWNQQAQSYQFKLQKQATREGILLFYERDTEASSVDRNTLQGQ